MDSKTIISTFMAFIISFVLVFVPGITTDRNKGEKWNNGTKNNTCYCDNNSIAVHSSPIII